MQSTILALIALLAPLPAAAFGNLDCITFQSCTDAGCEPATGVYFVTFDWANDGADVEFEGNDAFLPRTNTDTAPDGLGTLLTYANDRSNLAITANGPDITAIFAPTTGPTLTARCDVRQAA